MNKAVREFSGGFFRSFCLIKKNQKIKAYTPEATHSRCSAEISENSLRSNSRDFFTLRPGMGFTPLPLGRFRNNG